jgi:alanine racemase
MNFFSKLRKTTQNSQYFHSSFFGRRSEEREYTLAQIKLYTDNSDYILARTEDKPLRHCLNSPGITNYTEYQFDMVRIGIGMIGHTTNPAIQPLLQSAVCFKTVITQISHYTPENHWVITEDLKLQMILILPQ